MTDDYTNSILERLRDLERENIGTSNEQYRIANVIDFLESRIKHLEDLVIGDNK